MEKNDSAGQSALLDRNRSILLARDLFVLNDWVAIACKRSKPDGLRLLPGDAAELVSISVLGPNEKVLMDALVRPDGAVNSDLLKLHGCDPAHAFKAPLFRDIYMILSVGLAKSRVLCYDVKANMSILGDLCKQERLPLLAADFVDMRSVYSNFVGEQVLGSSAYRQQNLPSQADCSREGVSPLSECKHMVSLLAQMAGSSQSKNSADTFNKNWSAAFYKPKLGPADKIKEFLGF